MRDVVTNPKHLYRALLRETTHLFDTRARSYCYEYVRLSFRRHHVPPKASSKNEATQKLPSQAESRLLHRGRSFLAVLSRANQGYMRAVNYVLRITYARSGKRRRTMLSSIMSPESCESSFQQEKQATAMSSSIWRPPEQVYGLIKSQLPVHRFLKDRRKLTTNAKIPEHNIWGKLMPKSRVKNMNKKWYAKTVDELQVPLSETEWQEIYQKSTGSRTLNDKAHHARRPRGTLVFSVLAQQHQHDGADNLCSTLVDGPIKDPQLKYVLRRRQHPHRMTPRFLRRRMAQVVLKETPVAFADSVDNKIKYRWEEGKSPSKLATTCDDLQAKMLFG